MNDTIKGDKITRAFFDRENAPEIAKALLGKVLCVQNGEGLSAGIITETEAYQGRNDKACHAYGYRRTKRTEVMFGDPGHAYVYLCYGIHQLFNIVTNVKGEPDAILIRAVEPIAGLNHILSRRNKKSLKPMDTAGPGKVTQALGITKNHNQVDLINDQIYVLNRPSLDEELLGVSARIGVDYAEEDVDLPWRFYIKGSDFVSKKVTRG